MNRLNEQERAPWPMQIHEIVAQHNAMTKEISDYVGSLRSIRGSYSSMEDVDLAKDERAPVQLLRKALHAKQTEHAEFMNQTVKPEETLI